MSERRASRWLRPRYIFAVAALLLIATLLFTPAGNGPTSSYTITTFSTRPYGAQGIYEVAERLGWTVERRTAPMDTTLASDATYLVLAPREQLSAVETARLLRAVRAGASAVVTPFEGTPLADSLGIHRSDLGTYGATVVSGPDSAGAAQELAEEVARAAMHVGRFDYALEVDSAVWDRAIALAYVEIDTTEVPAIVSVNVGEGEVVALADVNFVRNVVARRGAGVLLAVRLFEWLDPARERPLVFDEYHQGFGERTSMPRTVRDALLHTAPGRTFLQLLAAALVLLLAYAVRPIAPLKRRSIERRSPLEHVGALARAYQQIEATRTGTQRLLKGLRRRRPLGPARSLDDDGYLTAVVDHDPELAGDVERIRGALARPVSASEWVEVGSAIHHIERTIAQ